VNFTTTVDFDGFDHARARTMAELGHQMSTAVTGASAKAVTHAQAHGAFRNRTGQLRHSIHVEPGSRNGRMAESWIVSPMFYSLYVEAGTKPHDIWPKAAHGTRKSALRTGQSAREKSDVGTHRVALRWYPSGSNAGAPRFAAMVHHPGSKAYPFMGPAATFAHGWLLEQLELGFYRLGLTIWN
jgi:hypothetical protein